MSVSSTATAHGRLSGRVTAITLRRIVLGSDVVTPTRHPRSQAWSQVTMRPANSGCHLDGAMRGVRELAEQPGDDERDLLADVHRVVADRAPARETPSSCASPTRGCRRRSRSRPRSWKNSRLRRVDLAVLAHEVLGEAHVAQRERLLGTARPRSAASRPICIDALEDLRRRPAARGRTAGCILAMFTHWSPMRSTCLITCSRAATMRRSAGHRRLQREQREDALVDLEVAAVDPVVIERPRSTPARRPGGRSASIVRSSALSTRSSAAERLLLERAAARAGSGPWPGVGHALAELPGDVVLRPVVVGVGEDLVRRGVLDDGAGAVLPRRRARR